MANPWFKMHADFYHDPKVQTMSEAMQRRLLMLFCLRCSDELGSLTDEEIQCALRISARQWLATKALFIAKGFIDEDLTVLNWNKRQHIDEDDGLTPEERRREKDRMRLKAWRARQREGQGSETDETQDETVSETAVKRYETASETETETETETEAETDRAFGLCPNATHARVSETPDETPEALQDKPPKAIRKRPEKSLLLGVDDVVAEDVQRENVECWFIVRKDKGAKHLSVKAWNRFKNQAAKAGISLDAAVQWCAEKNWQGFEADWYARQNGQPAFALARVSPPIHAQTANGDDSLVRPQSQPAFDGAYARLFGVTIDATV